jgi:hypothetical protein
MSPKEYVAITAAGAFESQMPANTIASHGTRRHPSRATPRHAQISSGKRASASSSAKSLR